MKKNINTNVFEGIKKDFIYLVNLKLGKDKVGSFPSWETIEIIEKLGLIDSQIDSEGYWYHITDKGFIFYEEVSNIF